MTLRQVTACLVLAVGFAAVAGPTTAKPKSTSTSTAKPKTPAATAVPPDAGKPEPVVIPPMPDVYNPAVGRDTGQFLPDTAVLARVGGRTIRVDQFLERYFGAWPEFRPGPDSVGRVEFLNTMISKDVVGQLALKVYREETFEERTVMREHIDRVLSNALYQHFVNDSIRVSEEDAYRCFLQYGYELHLKRLVFRDSLTAKKARDGLVKGRTTWTVAAAQQGLSTDQGLQEGDMGWVRRSVIDPQVATTVFDLKPGQISPVLFETWGYTIYQSIGRREIAKVDYFAFRSGIINELKLVQATRLSEAMLTQLRARTGLTHDTTNIAWASQSFPEIMTSGGPGNRGIEMNTTLPQFDPADTSRVLARLPGRTFTLGQFLTWYDAQSPYTRVSANSFQALRRQVDIAAQEPYLADIARERGLESDSLAISLINRRREEIRVERLFQDSVMSKIHLTEKDRRDYYNKNPALFLSYSRVRFARFHAETQEEADSLLARLKSGVSPEAIMREDSLAGRSRGSITWRIESDHGTPHQKVLFGELRPGDAMIDGAGDGHWDVLKSLEFDPGHQLRFDEVEMLIDESLQNITAQRLFDQLIERHKRGMAIASRPELVMRIRLVDPTL